MKSKSVQLLISLVITPTYARAGFITCGNNEEELMTTTVITRI